MGTNYNIYLVVSLEVLNQEFKQIILKDANAYVNLTAIVTLSTSSFITILVYHSIGYCCIKTFEKFVDGNKNHLFALDSTMKARLYISWDVD